MKGKQDNGSNDIQLNDTQLSNKNVALVITTVGLKSLSITKKPPSYPRTSKDNNVNLVFNSTRIAKATDVCH